MMHRLITGRLVIATHNPGKLAEMRELLVPHGVEAVSAGELGLDEPEETGGTFRANAAIKAIAAANAMQLPAFADDSGLVVDALDGAPGIYSARWAGEGKDFMAGRDAAICRELTKLHEDIKRAPISELARTAATLETRGEFVLVVGPPRDDANVMQL